MERLYYAKNKVITKEIDVIFVSNQTKNLEQEAEFMLNEEEDHRIRTNFSVKEITSIKQIPKEWKTKTAYIYGVDKEMLAEQWLKEQTKALDPEYKEYLRLSKKFS